MPIDLGPLWEFSHLAESEQRFRAALAMASGDDALILQTQIARSFSLRKDFARAQEPRMRRTPMSSTSWRSSTGLAATKAEPATMRRSRRS